MKKINQHNVIYNQKKDQLILAFAQQKKDLDTLVLSYQREHEFTLDKIKALKEAYPNDLWIVKRNVQVERESFVMVEIESDSFMMGATKSDSSAQQVEFPQHKVNLSKGLWMAVTPVTQALYEVVMRSNPSKQRDPLKPVENISWYDAIEFCNRIFRTSNKDQSKND